MFNKDLEELKSKQKMMNNTINEINDHLGGWDREGGRETQEGGGMGI